MKLYSLRRATLRAVIVPLLVAVALAAVSALWVSERAINTLRDGQMQQEARFLSLLARHEALEGELVGNINPEDSRSLRGYLGAKTGFRIWSGDVVVAQSSPATGLPPLVPRPGFTLWTVAGESWRTFALHDPDSPMVVEINELMAVRSAMNRQIVYSLALPLAALILLVAGIAYAQVAAALRPMQRITADLDSRGADDLRPLAGHRIPSEIAPLFEAFNRLLDRLGRTLQREREFSQNAAHELRTPLAVLKTRAQIAARDLAGDPTRHGQFDQLVAATDRATGVIDQLLILNRLDSAAATDIDLSRLIADICRDVAPEALARSQDFGAEIAPGVTISGQPDALAMMLRNLVENAIRHTPPHGSITITLASSPGDAVEIHVCDSGPGIPAAEREAVFDRFVRLDTATPGSGLGLAIVRRIVEQHGGRISLSDHLPHGLDVRVVMPRSIAAT